MNTKYSCQEVTFEKIKQLILLIEALNYGGLGFVLIIESTGIILVLSQYNSKENCLVRAAATTLMVLHDNDKDLGELQENFIAVETNIKQ